MKTRRSWTDEEFRDWATWMLVTASFLVSLYVVLVFVLTGGTW